MVSENIKNIVIGGLWKLFIWLIIILFSIIISSTVLGILSIFRIGYVVISSILISVGLFVFWGKDIVSVIPDNPVNDLNSVQSRNFSIFNWVGLGLSALLLILLIVPIMNWPMSFMEKTIIWDAGLYHFPKAVEMWSTGSAWDFSISYGDYPFGYESLLSFTLFFTKNIGQFSIAHVAILLLFILGTWFLTLKYSKLPPGIILLGIIFLILSGFLPVSNPWYFIHYLPYTIGKNDLFLAAASISAMVFVPLHKGEGQKTDWIGLGITSGLAISIKPNCIPILLFLWFYAFFFTDNAKSSRKTLLPGVIIASFGGGWIIRNLIGINKLFIPSSYRIVDRSIWSNLNNPDFYNHIPKGLIFSIVLSFGFLVLGLIKKTKISITDAFLFIFTFISFIITPASVNPHDPTALAWRFGLPMLMLQFVYLVAVLDSPARFLLARIMKSNLITYLTSGLMIFLFAVFFYSQKQILPKVPEYAGMLDRPYSVYDYDYLSVFDYVDENIHNSVVWIEGAQHYYAYDSNFTNSITRSKPAEYIIILNSSPDNFWFDVSNWDIIYQDPHGYVLKSHDTQSD